MKQTFTITSKLLLSLALLLCSSTAWSQTIRGVVTDSLSNPLPGTNVIIKGTTIGTTADASGAYSITNPQGMASNAVLVFSFIGYESVEIPYEGRTAIDVQLREDSRLMQEVVVTALGIEREQKALGYATQTLGENQLTDARSNNWSGALSGKVAGLTLNPTGSGPMNSTRIILRGENSLDPSRNNALIILDGVPMNSGLTSSGVSSAYGAGSGNDVPVDFGNGIADINPDDIESITVLKGASATALYGIRAGNGALIITTKSGARKSKGLGVSINSNISFNDVLRWPDYQYEYGQGTGRAFNSEGELFYSYRPSEDGPHTGGTSSAFGPRFEGQSYYQYDPDLDGQSAERVPWRPYKDNIKGFFRTGSTITNNISLEGGNQESSARLSLTHSKNEWIMPNTGYERITAALSINHRISEKIKVNAKVNYTNKQSDNLPATGYNNQSIAYFMIFQNPSIDLDWYRPIWKPGLDQIDQIHPFSSFIDNPFLIAHEMTNSVNNNTVIGNVSATYQITPELDVMVRSAVALSDEDREQKRPYSTANFQRGYFKRQDISNYEINSDVLLTYLKKISPSFDLRINAGANNRSDNYQRINGHVEGLVIPGVYNIANGINTPVLSTFFRKQVINSVYGLVSLSFLDKIFVDLTARNDWSSTLPKDNFSFFYPSVSTSFILSDLFQLPTAVSFAKFRFSVAGVGNDAGAYDTQKYYGSSPFPGSGSVDTRLYNVNLQPQNTESYEAGLEYILFNRRVGMDLAVYRNITDNQILDVPLDPTTGYFEAVLNSGEVRNQGVEIVAYGTPVQSSNFSWKTTLTWAKNYNEVLSLAEGLTDQQIIGQGGNATLIAKVGGTTGDIYGFGFLRAPDGQIIYNANGLPARPPEIQYIGNAYADWKGGWLNEFKYRNISMSVLIDGQYGGIVYSQTHHKMSEQGKLRHTLRGREDGFIIGDGVVANADGTYAPNTKEVNVATYYADYYRRANVESNSFDASFIKLREFRLAFNFPKSLLQRTPLQQATLAIYGRDLAMITDFPVFDPETAALNGGTILPGIEMGQLPSPRTYGFNITLKL
jgi:TonB-linked SusC/RagA family outer membrane protein